jgi:glyoxylase-like metal-dependent hydrolase (beta-lactamase superfamily II)
MTDTELPAVPPVRFTTYVGRWPNVPVEDMPEVMPSGTFSPTTATLISGETEAILVDAQYLAEDVKDLGDLIERTGKKLTAIFVTHAHADHYLGITELKRRFTTARCVALPEVVDAMRKSMEQQADQWDMLFGDACVKGELVPDVLEDKPTADHAAATLWVDGTAVHIVRVKQADIHPTSIVHVPSIGLVVSGDAIYNEIFPMTGLATPAEWDDWIETIDFIASLKPKIIVAGHRRPDGDDRDVDRMISETRRYIQSFKEAFATAKTEDEIVAAMSAKFPRHGNRWTLQFSAMNAIATRDPLLDLASGGKA